MRRTAGSFVRLGLLLLCASSGLSGQPAANLHPLDPLSGDEIRETVRILKAAGRIKESHRLPVVVLHEPAKADALGFRIGSKTRRQALVVAYEPERNKTFESVVDLGSGSVESWREVPHVQPPILLEEFLKTTPEVVRADRQWQAAVRKRGIADFENVQVDAWSAGYYGLPGEEGVRLVRAVSYYRAASKNAYSRPIEGVVAYVDLNKRRVVKLVDDGVVPVVKAASDLDPEAIGKLRPAPKPLKIVQPDGSSFEVNGHEVRWQKWRFRFALHPREGLVLYTVGYEDQGRLRSILYRASVSEMLVPYADPGPAWFFRNVFDEGEYGLGRMAASLEPLADAPSNALFFDAVFADDAGNPFDIRRAVALYERDGGVLWKHADYISGHNESRRARQLVLSFIATVGNYEYGFNWVFHQDGALESELLLTGIMQAKGVSAEPAGGNPGHDRHGHLVAPNIEAVHHQHFFSFRLDMDVDAATGNSVVELNTHTLPSGAGNPAQRAFTMTETPLRTERQAQRSLSLEASRKWKVINPSVTNALGQPVGYTLVPGENSVPYLPPDSPVRRRAGFLNAHLWVTPYEQEEMNAAGYYVNQSAGGEGLPRWTAKNRTIQKQDVVLWYTLGVTHMPRPEEWPVMPVYRTGFKLIPSGFFSRNPALDVPKPESRPPD